MTERRPPYTTADSPPTTCPTCGGVVSIASSGEGTNSYRPVKPADDDRTRLDALRAKLVALVDAQTAADATGRYLDSEAPHIEADAALLAYIDDPEVTRLFESLTRWYA